MKLQDHHADTTDKWKMECSDVIIGVVVEFMVMCIDEFDAGEGRSV
jgi:hypothetical protein